MLKMSNTPAYRWLIHKIFENGLFVFNMCVLSREYLPVAGKKRSGNKTKTSLSRVIHLTTIRTQDVGVIGRK